MSPPRAKCWQVVSESEFRAFIANYLPYMPEVAAHYERGVMLREFVDVHTGHPYPKSRVAYESLDKYKRRVYHIFATRPPYLRKTKLREDAK